ncbi:MAG TPA: WD40 repeat domain-containing serine/threonine protein kinase, partial [Gemmataceae bacterium]
AEDFARRLRRGERPSLSEYTSRHPELAGEIRDLFPALVVMEQFGSVADPAAVPPRAPAPPRLGDYRILREVGRGGMGVVYEAMQESLGRHVALKVLPAGGPGGASRERFRREARAAARLHHTNIVPVFAVGEDGDTLYYAMQFIRGQGLDVVLAEVRRLRADGPPAAATSDIARRLLTGQFVLSHRDTPVSPRREGSAPLADSVRGETEVLSTTGDLAAQPEARYWREVARLGIQAAEALHHAHQQGVLHRDVKPSNLLLDAAGTLWVTDFGLAKAADSDDLTGSGDLVGTLRYMAPERFQGHADARSDVYSLAVTLYELLTLRPAFDDTDRLTVIERIGRGDPPRVRSLAAEVPRDLETVIHKALARDPADRYAAAQEFADDLRRVLDGRPILARRHRLAEQAWRWCRRNPAVAALAGAVLALLAAVAVVSSVAAVRLGAALKTANDNLTRAVSAEIDADANRWRSHLLDARASRLSRAPGQRFAALASLRQAVAIARGRGMPPEWVAEMRTEAIAALALPDLYVERWWAGRPAGSTWLSFTADLATYARVDGDGAVSVRRVEDDAELHRLPALGGPGRTRLSPDGRSLFVYQMAEPARGQLWDLTARPPAVRAEMSDLDLYFGCSYRPDGRLVAVAHAGGVISVYDPATGRRVHHLAPDTAVREVRLALHPAAPLIAVSSYFCRDVLVRDLGSGAVVARLTPPWPGGGFATWHPSGRALCVGHGDGIEVRVYDFDPTTHALTYRRSLSANTGGGTDIFFDPTGDRAVVYGWGGMASLIDFPAGRVLFGAPAGFASWPQFGATGRSLGVAAQQDTTKVGIWSVADGRECRALVHGRQNIMRWPAASPDGRVVAVNLADGLVLVDPATGRELATVPFRTGGASVGHVGSYEFEPSGALLTNSWDGCFRWPLRPDPSAPGRLLLGPPQRLPFHEGIGPIAASRDGRVVAQAMDTAYGMGQYSGGWIVRPGDPLRGSPAGQPRRVLAGARGTRAAVSPDGRWVAFGLHDVGTVHVFDSATGRQVWEMTGTYRCLFTPDGRWLATEADGGRLYAVGTWAPGPQLGPGQLCCTSADGRLAVFATNDGFYRVVEVETGREVVRLQDPDHNASPATLTP